ncbi:uncharacterized protein BO88DRAFT_42493 [Aspergillus vadensis CBS 113365]|uniref:Uncharacterized protein n=1 Tax=Aspergillus vadensis (strain CBS 113365 / IMI 142717 / IBT 24658) TaxID=1448311 RepID=A0A319B9A3_ASPVC|nr:hypothetical protein BO88DRAFT_42493 [Aspergillus vadensis CBS 113365]PYH69125.1 hypothetical protein BO88DRAFT_42493 [Aspergillus vadensis CBS 113365]
MFHLIDNLFPPHLPPRSLSLSSSSLSTSIWHSPLFSYSTAPSYISFPHLSLSLTYSLPPSSSSSHLISSHLLQQLSLPILSYLYLICTGLASFCRVLLFLHFTVCPVDLSIYRAFLYYSLSLYSTLEILSNPLKSLDTDSSTSLLVHPT